MNHSYRALIVAAVFALFLAASCDNSGDGTGGKDDGSGGASSTSVNPASTSSGMGNTTSGNSMSTTSTGSGDVCTPSPEDPFCNGALSCQCQAMPGGMPPEAACPNSAGNVCTPGHNQCGCDLPMDTDYVMPDANCAGYVDGDIWQTENGTTESQAQTQPIQNGQYAVSFGAAFTPDASYFNGFVMSGKLLSWNEANSAMLDHCTGTFSSDCKSITLSCWHGADTTPFKQKTLINIVH